MKTIEKMIWNLENKGFTAVLSDYYLKKLRDYAKSQNMKTYEEEVHGRKFIYIYKEEE